VAAATQKRLLPFAAVARSGSRARAEVVYLDSGFEIDRPAPPVARPSAAAAPIDSRKVLRVVRMAFLLLLRGILGQLYRTGKEM
jgi:hypothetical protein